MLGNGVPPVGIVSGKKKIDFSLRTVFRKFQEAIFFYIGVKSYKNLYLDSACDIPGTVGTYGHTVPFAF